MRLFAWYHGAIRLTAAQDALYLSVLFVFRIAHPPLRIPWKEIKIAKTESYLDFTLGNEEKIPMRISERMAHNLGILERLPS
jgi:hypothetical protein